MIQLKKLSKSFSQQVLDGIDLTLQEGKIYVIKGISGCGKTTLLNILVGLDKKYDGEYLYNGIEVSKMKRKEYKSFRESISYMAQDSLLIGTLNVYDNLKFIADNEQAITKYADMFGVKVLLMKMPSQLSGGERQRIAMIRTLLRNPAVIIADEPTASLDYSNSKKIATELCKMKDDNRIVIVSTHEDIYDDIADVVINIEFGKICNVKENDVNEVVEVKKSTRSPQSFLLKQNMRYVHSQIKPLTYIATVAVLTFAFLIICTMFTVKFNFKREYVNKQNEIFPYQVFALEESEVEEYKNKVDMKVYNYYEIEEDGFTVYPLFPKEDSPFKTDELIVGGEFPENNDELLISDVLSDSLKDKGVPGSTIEIQGTEYNISGVVKTDDFNEQERKLHYSNRYYPQEPEKNVYMLYDKISAIIDETEPEDGEYMVKVFANDLYTNGYYEELFGELGDYGTNKNDIDNETAYPIYLADTGFVALVFILIIVVLFVIAYISLELFHRKREIGYLQYFGVKKSRIIYCMSMRYISQVLFSTIMAIILFHIGTNIIMVKEHMNFNLQFDLWGIILFGIVISTTLAIGLPLQKYMRKDAIELVKE